MGTYAKAFEIPEDFPAILREFAKEAIREQPTDIYRSADGNRIGDVIEDVNISEASL